MGYQEGVQPYAEGVFVKAPVFSFNKLKNVDITLGSYKLVMQVK